ncbi:MAG: preprotein translocase subunit SecE [Trichodesmium sp. MAG_R04]|nr:preprotein translocase subunit SecE [Trichodesmium sp. MAG_R04]
MAKKEEVGVQENKEDLNPLTFFRRTKEELDKVVWPSREQLISESVAVLLMVILSATIIYLVDELFSWAAGVVFG